MDFPKVNTQFLRKIRDLGKRNRSEFLRPETSSLCKFNLKLKSYKQLILSSIFEMLTIWTVLSSDLISFVVVSIR